MENAKKRGVKIVAEICGYGSSMDASSMTAPEGTGRWGKEAVLSALQEAEMISARIDVISTHGTGTFLSKR